MEGVAELKYVKEIIIIGCLFFVIHIGARAEYINFDPYSFYNYTKQATQVVQSGGNIYWSSAAKSSNSNTKFDNLYWDIQISNSQNQKIIVRIDELDYIKDRKRVGEWVYTVFEIPRQEILDMIVAEGYTLEQFSKGNIKVEFDGVIAIKKSDAIVEGPYALRVNKEYTQLMTKLEQYYFSNSSKNSIKTKYKDKTTTIDGDTLVHKYSLDINAYLDGKKTANLGDWAKADVYINNKLIKSKVNDFSQTLVEGSRYKICITEETGREIKGKRVFEGILNKNTSVEAQINTMTYANEINHYITKGQKVENQEEPMYHVGTTEFDVKFKQGYEITNHDYIDSPKGYKPYPQLATVRAGKQWKLYDIPYKEIQTASVTEFSMYYTPESYPIIYNLDGGVNNEENPETYTILDYIELKEPSKENYDFLGWYVGNKKVTGINDKKELDFSNSKTLLKQLEERSVGEIELTAKWNARPELIVEDIYIYLEDIDMLERFYRGIMAHDEEDGDITTQVLWENKELIIEKLQDYRSLEIEEDKEYIEVLQYSVIDSEGAKECKECNLHVYGVYEEQVQDGYIRFISKEYIETIEEDSVWRGEQMHDYLGNVLN